MPSQLIGDGGDARPILQIDRNATAFLERRAIEL
jgi:hypothetical protein